MPDQARSETSFPAGGGPPISALPASVNVVVNTLPGRFASFISLSVLPFPEGGGPPISALSARGVNVGKQWQTDATVCMLYWIDNRQALHAAPAVVIKRRISP